jgi:predicted enzyme related to lactoylglutathione lyase
MMRTPDGHGRIELSKFQRPAAICGGQNAPVNTLGMGRIMFQVEDLKEALVRLQAHGAKLVGEIVQYEDLYLLCYVRGPEGILIALAELLR